MCDGQGGCAWRRWHRARAGKPQDCARRRSHTRSAAASMPRAALMAQRARRRRAPRGARHARGQSGRGGVAAGAVLARTRRSVLSACVST